jgi:hypothetical protein
MARVRALGLTPSSAARACKRAKNLRRSLSEGASGTWPSSATPPKPTALTAIPCAPHPMTFDEVREMAMAIAKLPEMLMRRDKGRQDRNQHPPPSTGKVAARSRFDATPSLHSILAHSSIPRLNGRVRAAPTSAM